MPLGTLAGAFLSPVLGQVADKAFPKLDGLGSSIGNAIGGIFGRQDSVDTSIAAQKALFDYQSEYNSPLNQRKRLEEAGYNPALFYGSTLAGSNQAMPSSNVGGYQSSVDPLSLYKANNLQTNTDKTRSEITTEQLRQDVLSLDKESRAIANYIANGTKGYAIHRAFLENEKLGEEVEKVHAEMVKLVHEGENIHANTSLTQEMKKKVIAECNKLYKEAQYVVAQIEHLECLNGLTNMQKARVVEEIAGLKATNDINDYRNQFEKKLGWIGNDRVQKLIGMGVDAITDIAGFAKFFKNIPKVIGKDVSKTVVDPQGTTTTYETVRDVFE